MRDPAEVERIERELLSAVIREDAADDVDLEPGDFSTMPHRALWAAIRRCRADGVWPSDPALLEERCPEWQACGGTSYWSSLVAQAGLREMMPRYAAVIQAAALTRRLRVTLADLAGSQLESDDLLEECMRRLGAAGERRTETGRLMAEWMADAVRDLGRRMEAKQSGQEITSGMDTGLRDLDGLLCGIARGVLTVIGARPSIGKSALVRGIAEHVAVDHGVHYFSHEDAGDMVAMRSLASGSGVPVHRLLGCDYDRRDYAAVLDASARPEFGRLYLDDSAGLTSDQIALRVRRRKRQIGTALVVVDYVQLMREPGARNMVEVIGRASAGLVRLAREEHVAVIVCSQLNRESEKERGGPRLHHLRESGTLEQDAYAVLLLDRDRDKEPTVLKVEVAKHKNGPTGRVRLYFDGQHTAVRSLSYSGTGDYRDRTGTGE